MEILTCGEHLLPELAAEVLAGRKKIVGTTEGCYDLENDRWCPLTDDYLDPVEWLRQGPVKKLLPSCAEVRAQRDRFRVALEHLYEESTGGPEWSEVEKVLSEVNL